MGYDVFISYSHRDRKVADAACARLEQAGHRCWIAPRDVGGGEWGTRIMEGIRGARVFVLIFSTHANMSQQVNREVERAVNRGLPIIPLRIEDITPSGALEFFICNQHWLDALTPPLERHLDHLVDMVGGLLGREAPARPIALPASRGRTSPAWWWTGGAAAALGVAAIAGWAFYPGAQASDPPPAPVPAGPAPPRPTPAIPEPQPLESLLDFRYIETAPGSQIEAAPILLRAAIPIEIVSISPSSGRLLFLDSNSIEPFGNSALDRSDLLALVVLGNAPAYLELRFAEPVAEVHLRRPQVDDDSRVDRMLQFPTLTILALDSRGQPVAQADQVAWWSASNISREPPREIVLRAPGPEGIRFLRMRATGPIHRLDAFPARQACAIGRPCPPPPPEAYYAAIILNSIQARRMPRPAAPPP